MVTGRLTLLVVLALAATGCSTMRAIAGMPGPGEPSVTLKSAETRWLLIKNPRFGDVPSEPEYVWVEEDKVPTTFKTVFLGQRAIIALPEIVAKYGLPPGGGKISPRQGVPYQPPAEAARAEAPRAETGRAEASAPAAAPGARTGETRATTSALPESKRGYVVYVDTTRIVIDLTAADGVRAGSVISLRRDRIPVVHPVTGEVLGELDEEVGTARVTETRERFSVAEIQTVASGSQIQVRDRVVLK
ncbi:MAG TPA: hypothetical protein VGV13_22680 [Methylomirabilota bacterium]|jgi:hypothetical protein|nr:hypothetical protein [Methylomirabilota bacterium]